MKIKIPIKNPLKVIFNDNSYFYAYKIGGQLGMRLEHESEYSSQNPALSYFFKVISNSKWVE